MAATTGNIIRSAMRKIGVLDPGEPLPPNEGADALESLGQMVDAWGMESLLVPVVTTIEKELIAGQSEYTIGLLSSDTPPDNHIETSRPLQIITAVIRDSYNTDYTLKEIQASAYSRISVKDSESRPSQIYVREGWPLNTILFDSVPYDNETLRIEAIQPLSEILTTASLTDVVNLPPGYERALIYNLALELADEWGKQPSNMVAISATETKKWIKRNNYRPMVSTVDRALTNRSKGTFDINSVG